MSRLRILTALVASLFATTISAQECNRAPRDANFENAPVTIYLSPDQVTEVAFPEATLEGANPEKPDNLVFNRTTIPSKLSFSTTSNIYHGLLTVHGTSGRTYLLKFLARQGCADSFVKLMRPVERASTVGKTRASTGSGGIKKGLIDYLIDHPKAEDLPVYYEQRDFTGPRPQRMVFEQGSVKAYMHQQFIGERYIGTILEVENTGRSAIRVDIQNINYSDPTIIQTFGRVREITMNPFDFTLGPSPEYVSDLYSSTSRGYIYIVSQKSQNDG